MYTCKIMTELPEDMLIVLLSFLDMFDVNRASRSCCELK